MGGRLDPKGPYFRLLGCKFHSRMGSIQNSQTTETTTRGKKTNQLGENQIQLIVWHDGYNQHFPTKLLSFSSSSFLAIRVRGQRQRAAHVGWPNALNRPEKKKPRERERVACIRVCVFPASKVNAKAKEEDDKTWGEGDQTFLLLLLFLVGKKKKKEKRDDQEGCAAAGTTRKGSNKRCGLTLVYQAFINCFLTLYRYDIALLNCVPIGRQRRDRDAIVGSDPGERIKGRDGGQNLYRKRRKKVEEKEKKTIVMSLTGQLGIRIAPRVQVHLFLSFSTIDQRGRKTFFLARKFSCPPRCLPPRVCPTLVLYLFFFLPLGGLL